MENDIIIKPSKPNEIMQIGFCVAKVKFPNDLILKVGTKEECEVIHLTLVSLFDEQIKV